MEALKGEIADFQVHLCQREQKRPSQPTMALLELSPDMAMLFAPFGCTHPPPPVPPFLLSPKDIAGSDTMKLKV